MNDLEMYNAVNIVISDLEKKLRPTTTGHIHTTINTLRDYANELKKSINEKLELADNELRV
jgi:hypothetical protein|tara:strand:+ start:188 stop:370 length:183 start_codon:yes stop_codon:yes gene_type:complete